MQVAGVDKVITEKNLKKEDRMQRSLPSTSSQTSDMVATKKYKERNKRLLKHSIPSQSSQKSDSTSGSPFETSPKSPSSGEDFAKDQDFNWSYSLEKPQQQITSTKTSTQLRIALPNLAQIADMTDWCIKPHSS